MLDIIQSKITLFRGYILLPLLCSMSLISPNFDVKSIIFSQFWPFPKIAGKALSFFDNAVDPNHRDQARGQLGRNSRPRGRNFALNGTQGEVEVS